MAMNPRTTRGEQSSERREQILSIAAHLISQRGYSATTVRDIADEAGILSGSLYHHFSSKEAILQEILRTFMTDLYGRFEQIVAESSGPRETLDRLIEHAFETVVSKPDAVGLYQNESSFLATQPGFEFVKENSLQIESLWLGQIREGQRQGVFRDTLDAPIAYRFIRDSVWSTVAWYRPSGTHTAASLTENYLDLLHGGLLVD
ncbi:MULTISPECIES: TetR/AcrR family transcriptional regulator [Microbacterium]|uniref:TetR/AcrR family transcriptional regulator n=1 Tax=Microbacterium resistens TaxID=156977 RepID=A0ABY3RPW0_9MICO|nr:TetR/AcrR family transcriptional regulator [Microbacterium resistens]MBW1640312.1 TetR/AcrR family transcriptional regulator [Microbacterium resistens]UGS26103.1 TetR/AcrR family transcriptional regulator [Microbacterium resistens]